MNSNSRDNSGAIFINNRREQDNQPDRTGKATIDGVDYYISAWTKQGQRGPYISLSFQKRVPGDPKQTGKPVAAKA